MSIFCGNNLHGCFLPSLALSRSFLLFLRGLSAAIGGEQASCAEGLLEVKDEEGNGLSEDELKVNMLTVAMPQLRLQILDVFTVLLSSSA